jgi:hypothetical protein
MSDDQDRDPPKHDRIKPVSRKVTRITQSVFTRVKQAPWFPEIDRRLRLGWSSLDLARAIQEEFNAFTDTSVKYLRKLLDRYRMQIPRTELVATSASPKVLKNSLAAVARGLDELAQLENLYLRQLDRIAIDEANEQKIGKLLDGTANEFVVAAKILKQSAELKMDLGINKRQVGSVEITGQIAANVTNRYQNDTVGKIIADPNARKKLMGLANKILVLSAKAGVDAVDVASTAPDETLQVIDVPSEDVTDNKLKIDDSEGDSNDQV